MSYRRTKFIKVVEPLKKGAYFYFTIPYGLFYIGGAIAGYARDKSYLCLGVSGSIGVVFVLLGIGHMIDYHRTNVAIEAFFLLIPLLVSFIVMVLMACHYGIGAGWMPSGFVAVAAGVGVAFYIYSFIRDFGKQLVKTGDARFLKGDTVYKRVQIGDEEEREVREGLLFRRNFAKALSNERDLFDGKGASQSSAGLSKRPNATSSTANGGTNKSGSYSINRQGNAASAAASGVYDDNSSPQRGGLWDSKREPELSPQL